jgi:hypothetical protein
MPKEILYRPRKLALRFSRNAAIPSFLSSVEEKDGKSLAVNSSKTF